ncbi:MAG: tail fiber domain-containing protein [Desulfurellales bacterium]|nr:MAG: tail fiber domain-containing protein [Desulfurellales bacterium]
MSKSSTPKSTSKPLTAADLTSYYNAIDTLSGGTHTPATTQRRWVADAAVGPDPNNPASWFSGGKNGDNWDSTGNLGGHWETVTTPGQDAPGRLSMFATNGTPTTDYQRVGAGITPERVTAAQVGEVPQVQAGTIAAPGVVRPQRVQAGTIAAPGTVQAGTIAAPGTVQAGTIAAPGTVQAGTIAAPGTVQAGTIAAPGTVQAERVSTGRPDLTADAVTYNELTPAQLQALGGLGATRTADTERARRQAIEQIASDASLDVFQRGRSRQLTDQDYTARLDAINKETEAAISQLASEQRARTLAAQTANADRALQAGTANAQMGLQASSQNAANALQAGLQGQQLGVDVARQNAANQLQAALQGQQLGVDVARQNAANRLQASSQNAGNWLQAALQGQQLGVDVARQNAGNQLQVSSQNAGNWLQTALANAAMQNNSAQFNSTQSLQAQSTNLQAALEEARRKYAADAANAALPRDDLTALANIFFGGKGNTQSSGGTSSSVDAAKVAEVALAAAAFFSSQALKDDIEALPASGAVLTLQPVSYRWRPGTEGLRAGHDGIGFDVGLIAEQVAEMVPALAARDADGQVIGVRYHLLAVLLLAEVQAQREELAAVRAELAALRTGG